MLHYRQRLSFRNGNGASVHMTKKLKLTYSQILISLTILFVFLFGYLFFKNLSPFIGVTVDNSNESDTYIISDLHRLGWGKAVGLLEEDHIVAIEGRPPSEYETVISDMRIERATSLTVKRDNKTQIYEVTYLSDIFLQYFFYLILPSMYFLISLLFVYLNEREKALERSTLLITITLLCISTAYNASSLHMKLAPLADSFLIVSTLISPSFFFHFLYQFFKERDAVWFKGWMVKAMHSFSIIMILIGLLIQGKIDINNFMLPVFSISIAWILIQMFIGITQLKKESDKDTLYGLFYATGLGVLPYIFFYVIPYFAMGESVMPSEYVSVFFFFIPMGLMYMILTNQLYLLRIQIKKLPYYFLISAFLSAAITFLHLILFDSSVQFIQEFNFFSYTLVIILVLLFVKKQLEHYFKPQFFVSPNDFQASYFRFSTQLKTYHTRRDVIQSFVREMREVIPLEHFKISKQRSMFMPNSHDSTLPNRYLPLLNFYKNQRLDVGRIVGRFGLYAIPINNYQGELFVFFFHPKQQLSQEQLNYVSTLVQFVNLALENRTRIEHLLEELEEAKHHDNMEWLSRLLFEWSELERKQMALDFHDTFLQDLIVLKRDLESLRKAEIKNTSDYMAIEERMQDIIFDIRETTRHLYPTILDELGLEEAIKELVEKFSLQCNSKLHLQSNLGPSFHQSRFIKLLGYRAVQELLTNANKHAKASKVYLNIHNEGKGLRIDYKDDGVGVDALKQESDDAHHLGLFALNERVKSFKGTFDFNSKVGEGVTVKIYIPYS